jgi:hypothetical protein
VIWEQLCKGDISNKQKDVSIKTYDDVSDARETSLTPPFFFEKLLALISYFPLKD